MDPQGHLTEALLPKAQETKTMETQTESVFRPITTASTGMQTSIVETFSEETTSARSITDLFQLYSALIGVIMGCFIQLSSLGANYLLAEMHLPNPNILQYSLVWSSITSALGVFSLLLIRCLLKSAHQLQCIDTLLLQLECYFSVGCLSGVCLAWTITDLVLGLNAHILHSLATLLGAMLWGKVISLVFYHEQQQKRPQEIDVSDDDSVSSDVSLAKILDITKSPSFDGRYAAACLLLGLIIGCFIEMASLGANFILGNVYKLHDPVHILFFSLGWSIVTSTMGVSVLTLVRSLSTLAMEATRQDEDDSDDSLWRLEGYFAAGALVGVNAAWIATDLVLQLPVHWLHVTVTEVLALGIALYALQAVAKRPPNKKMTAKEAGYVALV